MSGKKFESNTWTFLIENYTRYSRNKIYLACNRINTSTSGTKFESYNFAASFGNIFNNYFKAILQKLSLAIRETVTSRHNVGTIKGLPETPQCDSAVMVRGLSIEPHDAEKRQSLGQLIESLAYFPKSCRSLTMNSCITKMNLNCKLKINHTKTENERAPKTRCVTINIRNMDTNILHH